MGKEDLVGATETLGAGEGAQTTRGARETVLHNLAQQTVHFAIAPNGMPTLVALGLPEVVQLSTSEEPADKE